MQIRNFSEVDWSAYAEQRGKLSYKQLGSGEPDEPDNFEFVINRWGEGGTDSPRHRHNFDQFRYPIEKPMNYAPGKDVEVGQIGYFPEGAHYGRQVIPEGTVAMIVQFGGASGHGYLPWEALRRGQQELSKQGTFEKGVYRRDDGTQQDGYEAIWEHMQGRPVEYPKPRYLEPVVINPDAYGWQNVDQGSGEVRFRQFGVFNERGTAASEYHFAAGSSLRLTATDQRRLLFVTDGQVVLDGNGLASTHSGITVEAHETVEVAAAEAEASVLCFMMPRFVARKPR